MADLYHDHESLEAFVRDLAKANVYNSHDTGHVITEYWKTEAEEWVKEFDACLTPTLPVSAIRPAQDTVAQKLSGYDDATWSRLREDRKRTYRRAADTLIIQWSEFSALFQA